MAASGTAPKAGTTQDPTMPAKLGTSSSSSEPSPISSADTCVQRAAPRAQATGWVEGIGADVDLP
jgi:hypothetical protein